MRSSRSVTITILAGLMLTGCCIFSQGCGSRRTTQQQKHQDPPDYTWYDANGNPLPEKWKTDATGNKVLDEQGRPIPEPGVPYDRYRRPWIFVGSAWTPLSPPITYTSSSSSSSSRSSSSSWLFGGSGYRSTGTTTTYRPSGGSSSSSGSGLPSGSSITRGGFGSTGSSSSSSS